MDTIHKLILFKGVGGPTVNQQFDALVAALSPLYAYNVADAATRWRNDAGTLPATTAGQTIGRLDDKSTNARNASQATSAAKPTLGNSGALWWIDGDGVDDFLRTTTFAVTQPWWRMSAIRQISWKAAGRVFGPAFASSAFLLQAGSSPALALYDGTGAQPSNTGAVIGADAVVYESHNGNSSLLGVDAGATPPGPPSPGTTAGDGVTIFSDATGIVFGNIRVYATIAGSGTLTAPQIASVRTVLAALQGRTL